MIKNVVKPEGYLTFYICTEFVSVVWLPSKPRKARQDTTIMCHGEAKHCKM